MWWLGASSRRKLRLITVNDDGAPAASKAVASSDHRIKECLVWVGDTRRKPSETLVLQVDRARGHEAPAQCEGLTMKYASHT